MNNIFAERGRTFKSLGESIIIIEDVVTTGGSVKEVSSRSFGSTVKE